MNTDKPIANPLIVLREEFDDWGLIFDPDSGKVSTLNSTGVFIWKHLDGNHTEQDLLNELMQHFRNVPDEAGAHLKELIRQLVERGFVGFELDEV